MSAETDKKYAEYDARIKAAHGRYNAYSDMARAAEEEAAAICKERDAWEQTIVEDEEVCEGRA